MRSIALVSTAVFRPFVASRRAGRGMSVSAAAWSEQDERRMVHAVCRVGNMEEYVKYAQDVFGMKLLRYKDYPELKYSNAYLGFGPEDTHMALQLVYNYGVESYNLGTGFGHFGLAVNDVYSTVAAVKAAEGKVTREAGPVKGGKTNIAFVADPTGYSWELIERPGAIREPLAQVMLRVGDLDRSIKFYTEALGLKLLRTRENPEYKYTLAFLGFGDEADNCVFELTYNWDKSEYDLGEGYAKVTLSTNDVYKTAEQVRAAGGKIVREPGPVPGQDLKITICADPDGWKVVFVDNQDFLADLAASK